MTNQTGKVISRVWRAIWLTVSYLRLTPTARVVSKVMLMNDLNERASKLAWKKAESLEADESVGITD